MQIAKAFYRNRASFQFSNFLIPLSPLSEVDLSSISFFNLKLMEHFSICKYTNIDKIYELDLQIAVKNFA